MPPVIDETGKRYGKLIVIRRNGSTRGGGVKWLCVCDCGNETTVLGDLLRRGTTKSCGCLRLESIMRATEAWKLPKGESAFNYIFGDNQRRARLSGHEWKLTKEQVREIISQPCFYCGIPFSNNFGEKHGFNGGVKYNGLDRIDNDKGYIIDNVVPCCRSCNIAKNNRSLEDFKRWIDDVYHHWVAN
jgi:hypothetical protein